MNRDGFKTKTKILQAENYSISSEFLEKIITHRIIGFGSYFIKAILFFLKLTNRYLIIHSESTTMLITLLIFNFLVSFITCSIIAYFFKKPLDKIFLRLVKEDIYQAWSRYTLFAIFVVGISGGVRVWDMEKYLTTDTKGALSIILTSERWALEIYKSIMGTLEANAWMLLLVFLFALIAFVVIKLNENSQENKERQFKAMMEDKAKN
jgi:hypothetical protein